MISLLEVCLEKLKAEGIRLSHPRLKILEFMLQSDIHPTADQLYLALHQEIPSLSKTTVYNTMKILVQTGLVKAIHLEDHETRFDLTQQPHGHFKCLSCGLIQDVPLTTIDFDHQELQKFCIKDLELSVKGYCPQCDGNINI